MNDSDKVALIVNCYNSAKYLDETLSSLVGQSYDNYEIFCIDNCSSDNTVSIINNYAETRDYVTLLSLDHHVSLVEARIFALNNIQLESDFSYFGFCDSDDLWEQDWLSRLIDASSGHDLLFCNGYELRQNSNSLFQVENCMSKNKFDTFSSYLYLQSVLFSTRLLTKDFYLDTSFPMLYDMDLFERLKEKDVSYVHLSDRLFKYRVHPDSLVATKKIEIMIERYKITRKHDMSMFRFYIKALVSFLGIGKFSRHILGKFFR